MRLFPHPEGALRAAYADSEGHAIDHLVGTVPDERRVVFESAGSGPRFRLVSRAMLDGSLAT